MEPEEPLLYLTVLADSFPSTVPYTAAPYSTTSLGGLTMAYKRPRGPEPLPKGTELTQSMTGIGFNLAARPDREADLERTLAHASELGMEHHDLRVLGLLTTWVGVHQRMICVDRLLRFLDEHPSERVRAYWSAVAAAPKADRRLQPLVALHSEGAVNLLPTGTKFQLQRHGQDERFLGSALRVPANALPVRLADVMTPEQLAGCHGGYALRVMMGPSYRAVLWNLLEHDSSLSVADLARRARSGFATAWETVRDYRICVSSAGGPHIAAS